MKAFFRLEMIAVLVIGLFSATFLKMTFAYGKKAAMFPRIISIFVLIIAIYYVIGQVVAAIKQPQGSSPVAAKKLAEPETKILGQAPRNVLIGSFLVYALLIYVIGFAGATLCYGIGIPYIAGYRKKAVIIVFAVAMTIMMVVIGKVFMIPLPEGLIITKLLS